MNQFLQNLTGLGGMTDQIIATDFLISSKYAVINTAAAITETATPELREALRQQLRQAVETHESISNFMISRGYYHPHELKEQLQVDLQAAQTALDLQQ